MSLFVSDQINDGIVHTRLSHIEVNGIEISTNNVHIENPVDHSLETKSNNSEIVQTSLNQVNVKREWK